MTALLRRYLWVGVIIAVGVGIVAAIWLAGAVAGPPAPPPNLG